MPGIDEAYWRMTAFDLKHSSRSLLRRLLKKPPTLYEPGANQSLAWPALSRASTMAFHRM